MEARGCSARAKRKQWHAPSPPTRFRTHNKISPASPTKFFSFWWPSKTRAAWVLASPPPLPGSAAASQSGTGHRRRVESVEADTSSPALQKRT